MKYVYLVFDPADAGQHDDAVQAFADCGQRLLLAAHLEPAPTASERQQHASPAALAVIEAHDLNAAILLASRCAAARSATIEIRPLAPPTKETER